MPLFQLGSAFAGQLDLVREAQGVARDVAAACDEAVHVAVLDGADVIYLVKVDSTHPVRMVSAVGRRLPAHCTAVGKMLLSSLDPTDLDALLPTGDLSAMTPDSITDPDRFRADSIASAPRAWRSTTASPTARSAASRAPVRDHTGTTVAAMSVSAPIIRWTPRRTRSGPGWSARAPPRCRPGWATGATIVRSLFNRLQLAPKH